MYLLLLLFLSIVFIVFFSAKLKIHPLIVLLTVSILYGFSAGMPLKEIISSINSGFGDTLG
ncbi:MAG: GntP family permease, partial [Ignavibacteria bacterium]